MDINRMMTVVITFVIIGIMVGIGMLVLSDFGTQVATQIAVDNDSIVPANGTWVDFDNDYLVADPTLCQNITGGETIATTNYEINQTAGALRQIINGTMGNGSADPDVACDYSYYDYNSSPYVPVQQTWQAIGDLTTWFSVMIIVVAAAIIIGLVVKSFRG